MARVFPGCADVPIGSLKSNLGHLITAAGVAGLIKVLGAMEHGLRPPTLHAEEPVDALDGTPFRLLHAAEPWDGPRRAAVSAFGFGGNNAHLIVEAWDEFQDRAGTCRCPRRRRSRPSRSPSSASARAWPTARACTTSPTRSSTARRGTSRAPPSPSRSRGCASRPPTSPTRSRSRRWCSRRPGRPRRRSRSRASAPRVLVGMGCDPEIARYGARWRVAAWAAGWAESEGGAVDPEWLAAARDAFQSGLKAAGVVGTMPNIPANRINSQLDVAGPSFTVSAEEASGLVALDLAVRALRAGEIDAAVVGAVDLSCEPVHRAALESLGHRRAPGDAAVVLVLKRLADARRDGEPGPRGARRGRGRRHARPRRRLRRARPRTDLRRSPRGHGAAARRRGRARAAPPRATAARGVGHALVRGAPRRGRDRGAGGAAAGGAARAGATAWRGWRIEPPPRLHVFSGRDREGALVALEARRESDAGPARLVLVAADGDELAARADAAQRWLAAGRAATGGRRLPRAPRRRRAGVRLHRRRPPPTRAWAASSRSALPGARRRRRRALRGDAPPTDWLYGPGDGTPAHPLEQLWGTSLRLPAPRRADARPARLCAPARPSATRRARSNALFALGRVDRPRRDDPREPRRATIFTRELARRLRCAATRVGAARPGRRDVGELASCSAPVEHVRAALAGEPLAHLTIINTPEDCVIGGEAAACERVLARLGRERALPLGYDIAVALPGGRRRSAPTWRALHHRATRRRAGRALLHARDRRLVPCRRRTRRPTRSPAQAVRTLDFPRLVERAYADGVRVFVEHGPRGLCTGWIQRILGERDHLAVPLDVAGRSGAAPGDRTPRPGSLAAGVDVRCTRARRSALVGLAAAAARPGPAADRCAAHAPAPRLPAFEPSRPGRWRARRGSARCWRIRCRGRSRRRRSAPRP